MSGKNVISYSTGDAIIDGTSGIGLDRTTGEGGIHVIPTNAKGAFITFAGAGVRWRIDGTAASTGTGHFQSANTALTFDSWTAPGIDWRSAMKKFKYSPSSSGTVSIQVTFFD